MDWIFGLRIIVNFLDVIMVLRLWSFVLFFCVVVVFLQQPLSLEIHTKIQVR